MSEPAKYEEFDLRVEKSGRGYVAVASTPAGAGRSAFRPPWPDDELQRILARVAAPERDVRPAESPRETVEAVGTRLFEALFSGEVGTLWRESRAQTRAEGKGLRLRLRLGGAPRFESWPWELLYDPSRRKFLALSVRTPVVRSLDLPIPPESPPAEPPLRMLVAVAQPSGHAALDADRELELLRQGLKSWEDRGWLALDRLESATLEGLAAKLQEPVEILHVVGHGRFDPSRREGALVLEDGAGRARIIPGSRLGAILSDQKTIRLVVLSSCEGAATYRDDPFAGVAQALAGRGIPAVIAMRSRISDSAAVAFAEHFYGALGRNLPVDAALAHARRALFARPERLEWAAPVLYARSADCRLFRFPEPVGPWRRAQVRAWVAAAALSVLVALVGAVYPFMNKAVPAGEPKAAPADPNLTYVAQNPPECPSPPDLPMAFVKVPPGGFFTADQPSREIAIARPFCIGRFEVTQAQWKKIMGSNPSDHKGDALPVEKVLWEEAREFLMRLNARMPGANFRLPTDAQWEYAARAGMAGPYSFKGNPEGLSRYGNCQDSHGGTIPVGSLAPNPWGIFDMYGNVAEWVADGAAPLAGAVSKHVRRGGGFRSVPGSCDSVTPSVVQSRRNNDTGFRIVRDLGDS